MAAFRITQSALARQLGLSQATVSRALCGSPLLPKETITRVKVAAAAGGYRPDPGLASLVAYRRTQHPPGNGQCLAWLVSSHPADLPSRRSYPEKIFAGAQQRAHEMGYRLESIRTDAPEMTPKRLSRMLNYRRVEGIVFAPHFTPNTDLPVSLDDFASVAIGYTIHSPRIDRVAHHHFYSLLTIYEQLHRRGYRRIGLGLPPPSNARSDGLWLAAYLLARTRFPEGAGLPVLQTNETDAASFSAWLKTYKPDSLILHLAQSGARLDQLKSLNIDFPGDIGIALLSLPDGYETFSGIDERPTELGAFAIEALVSRMHHYQRGIPELPRVHMVEGSWREGTTVRASA